MSELDTSKIRVAALSDQDSIALAQFYRQAWNASAPADDTAPNQVAPNQGCPFVAGLPPPVTGVFVDEQIVGHLGSIPTELWDGSRSHGAHWLKGFMVLESYRNGPIGYLLLKHMMKQVSLSAVMTVAPAARRLFAACGFKDFGSVPNYITVIRPTRLLQAIDPDKLGLASLPAALRSVMRAAKLGPVAWLLGGCAGLGLALLDAVNWVWAWGLQARVLKGPPPIAEIDELWRQLRERLDLAPSRSGAYIDWRYVASSAGRYEFIEVRRGKRLAALAVVRRSERVDERLAGLHLGLVVDLIVDPQDSAAAGAALLAARGWGRRAGCDAVLLTISHRGIGRLVKRLGYVKIPGNVNFMLRVPSGVPTEAMHAPKDMERSWLTRGDAWGDDI